MDSKKLVIFAGPNGSGKSTIVNNAIVLGQCPAKFICPDNFVAREDKENEEAYRIAQREAEQVRHTLIAQGEPFSFETVLSIKDKLEFIKYAKYHGYHVHVVYVTTRSPEINLERVKIRVAQGGHNVPTNKVLSRYEKSMGLMFDVVREAHRADVYDNSEDRPQFVAAKINETYCFCKRPPDWLEKYLISKVVQHKLPIGTIKNRK